MLQDSAAPAAASVLAPAVAPASFARNRALAASIATGCPSGPLISTLSVTVHRARVFSQKISAAVSPDIALRYKVCAICTLAWQLPYANSSAKCLRKVSSRQSKGHQLRHPCALLISGFKGRTRHCFSLARPLFYRREKPLKISL